MARLVKFIVILHLYNIEIDVYDETERICHKDGIILVYFLALVSGSFHEQEQVLSGEMLVANRQWGEWGEEFMPISWVIMLNLGLKNAPTKQYDKDNRFVGIFEKDPLRNHIKLVGKAPHMLPPFVPMLKFPN